MANNPFIFQPGATANTSKNDLIAVFAKIEVNDAVKQTSAEASTQLAQWVKKSFSNSLKSSEFRSRLATMHEELGEVARKEMIRAYKAGKKRGRKPYRFADTGKLKRYSKGAMDKGLASDRLIVTSARGIGFNFLELDRYAKQWARLNFGASPAGSKEVGKEKIKIFRKSLNDSPSLSRFGARPGFLVPSSPLISKKGSDKKGRGAVGVGSGKPFDRTPSARSIVQTPGGPYIYVYPFKTKGLSKRSFKPKASKGIVGWRFLDKGIAKMNQEYGRKLTSVLEEYIKDSQKKSTSGPKEKKVVVKTKAAKRKFGNKPGQIGGTLGSAASLNRRTPPLRGPDGRFIPRNPLT